MPNKKLVQIILIILCAITILAGCANVQPQDEVAQTDLQTTVPTQAATDASTVSPMQEPTETLTQAPTEAPTEAPTPSPTPAPTEAPTEAPTPSPTPAPTEAPTPSPSLQENIITISIDCRNASEAGVAGAPEGGWIMGTKEVELQEGDTVWTILDRICRQRGIAVSKSGSGASVFIKAIGGVTPVSAQSGWMFSVNGSYIMTSAGTCIVKAGDKIRWKYTMDGGGDI